MPIDALIDALGRDDAIIDSLAQAGELALLRLLERLELGTLLAPEDVHPDDFMDALTRAFGRLTTLNPQAFLDEVEARGLQRFIFLLWAMKSIDDPQHTERIVVLASAAYRKGKTGGERWAAVHLLEGHAEPRSVRTLVRALGDRDHAVQFAAIEALARVGDEQAIAPLQALLGRRWIDEHAGFPRAINEALSAIEDRRAVAPE